MNGFREERFGGSKQESLEDKAERIFRNAIVFLKQQGIEVPDGIKAKVSGKVGALRAVSLIPESEYEDPWASLVTSELKNRYGMEVMSDSVPSTVEHFDDLSDEDCEGADILLSTFMLSEDTYSNHVMHELWHVVTHKLKDWKKTPFLIEAEAHYAGNLYNNADGLLAHSEKSVPWYKYEATSEIVKRIMDREGKSLGDLFHDDDLRQRLNDEVEKFYRDPTKTPGYIVIPHSNKLLGALVSGTGKTAFTQESIAQAYEAIDKPELASAVRNATNVDELIEAVKIAYDTPFH